MLKIKSKSLALICLVLVLSAVYYADRMIQPGSLRVKAQRMLEESLGKKVSLESANLSFRGGLGLTMKGLKIGSPDSLYIDAEKVKAGFSILNILLGKPVLNSLKITSPKITAQMQGLKGLGQGGKPGVLPRAEIENGSATIYYKSKKISLTGISGGVSNQTADFQCKVFDCKAQIIASTARQGWMAAVKFTGLDLVRLDKDLKGKSDIFLNLTKLGPETTIDMEQKLTGLTLPGGEKPIKKLTLLASADLKKDFIRINRLSMNGGFVKISGKGRLSGQLGPDHIKDARLDLKLASNSFDYNEFTSHMPGNLLPQWLKKLLFSQIRQGRMEISNLAFSGKIQDLSDGEALAAALHIAASIKGASFGAGYGPERIQGINAGVTYGSGNLDFRNISGRIGKSKIKSIDLLFPGIIDQGLRLKVKVDADMAASDFADLWRAAMVPEEAHDLISPLAGIDSGTIKAGVIFKDETNGKPEVKGCLEVSNFSFSWGGKVFKNITGKINAFDFSSPLEMVLKGWAGSLPAEKLLVSLKNPFEKPAYTFSMKTGPLPKMGAFIPAPDMEMVLEGSGKGPIVNGLVKINTRGFSLFGRQLRSDGGRMKGQGKFTGRLWPEFMADFKGIDFIMGRKKIGLSSKLTEHGGNVIISGTVSGYEARQDHSKSPVKGGLHLALAWGDGMPLEGSVGLENFSIQYKDKPLAMTGLISINGKRASTRKFDIAAAKGFQAALAGVLVFDTPMRFNGDIKIKWLNLARGKKAGSIPDWIDAEAGMKISDSTFFGMSFDNGKADLSLRNGSLVVDGIDLNGKSGRIKGKIDVPNHGKKGFDLYLDLRNKGLEHLITSLSGNKNLINGYMRLDGHLWGKTDSINGAVNFSARDGYAFKAPLLAKIFGALNIYKILKSKKIDFASNRFNYNNISVGLKIKNSKAGFNDFLLDSDTIQLSAIGDYDINLKKIDARVGIQPLETIDKAISAIPILGWVLTGDGGKLIVISMKVEGDIRDPSVKLAPVDSVTQPVMDTLFRILKLPREIIKRPGEMVGVRK